MVAARTVEIRENDAGVTVTTQSRYPLVAVPGFLLSGTLWLGLLIIAGGGALGFISPGTANLPTRVFAGLFTVIWAALGFWSGPTLFRKAFTRSEFEASGSGVHVCHTSFLGGSQRDYSWDQVDRFTEVVTSGEFNRDLAMVICGRHVALDYNLPAKGAAHAVAALTRCLEKYRRKCANPTLQATAAPPHA